jgi:thiamine transport system ATP-binding protein
MALALRGLTVRYGSVTAVSDVDLSVADGSVVALLGPSGCGKSTLLRAVAGLEPAAAGRVCWDGADLAGVPVHRREFGLVFQDGQLFPHRNVAGNVSFGLRGLPRTEARSRVASLLDLVGLTGYESRPSTSLSGGEQQRVALARALAPHPRLLLLDEPLSALDRALREQLAVDLARVLAGKTALVVTHDHDEAFTLADRVAVMRAGRIVQTGPPTSVWRRPADEETARFLGCSAFVPATVRSGVARCELGVVALPWAGDGDAVLGLRPSALRASALRSSVLRSSDAGVKGEVLQRVHRRDHVRLRVRLSTGREVDAVAGVLDTDDTVTLTLDPDGVALIDRSG